MFGTLQVVHQVLSNSKILSSANSMSSSLTPPMPVTTEEACRSDLEDLIIQVRYFNHLTITVLSSLPHLRLLVPDPHLHQVLEGLRAQCEDLKTHYGWALASDHEQVARVESKLCSRITSKYEEERNDWIKAWGESETVKGSLGAFGRLEAELGTVYVEYAESVRKREGL
ncbi:hypothetical protein T440DRAFT_527473 [Plenodomus tracheiphilus IPT5]|uniref:Uncharacterized protein n=1 Tax=Plenodomus tracheiphilus IPT5 TaxID=1408161 RepID=A0A6A7BCA7_9PLEO|nr:hypothetical protein T440DRAFT_527473 [Plenodomus tracheiphilus IPT5]